MPVSNYLENKLIDFIWRGEEFTPPEKVYVALFTTAPNDAGGGTEVSGGSYARVEVDCSLLAWSGTQALGSTAASSGSSGTTANNAAIVFPAPTANWGTVTHFGLFDAASAGHLLQYGPLQMSRTINNGDAAAQFPESNLTLTLD